MRSDERARRLEISSSSRRMSRMASSRLARASGPRSVIASPLSHRAAQDRHQIFDVKKTIRFAADFICLDDAIVPLVSGNGVVDLFRYTHAPDRHDLGLVRLLVED